MAAPKYFNQLYQQDAKYFNYIEGLRAIAAFCVILHHIAIFAPIFLPPAEFVKLFEHPFFKIALSTTVSLDIFFVISGLVIGYGLIKELKETGSVNFYRFMIRRVARVYPVYLLIILFCGFFSTDTFQNAWYNILEINNLLPIQEQHIPWAWSLAVDFQFYLVFSIILWLISKKFLGKKACTVLAIAIFILPIVSTILIVNFHHFHSFSPNLFNLRNEESWDYFNVGFGQFYVRCAPFLYGVLTAYILVHHKNALQQILQKINKNIINLTAVALFITFFFLVANEPIWFLNEKKAVWQTSPHWSLLTLRNIFSLLLCVLLLLAQFPKGLVLNLFCKVLNSALWRPFGQLTFATYMIHPIVLRVGYLVFFVGHTTTTAVEYWKYGLWLVLLIYLISVPLYLFIEQPAMDYLKQKLLRSEPQKEEFALASEGTPAA